MPQLPQPGEGQRSQSKFIIYENFEKLNTQSARQGLSERELAWLENLQPVAPNKLVIIPAAVATALATLSTNLTLSYYADLGGTDYLICFQSDGSASAVNLSTAAINQFAAPGTFGTGVDENNNYNPLYFPDCTTWQASRVLIYDWIAGYCTFDGTLFVKQGQVSPNITITDGGSGYGAAPSVTISGGSGTGATAVAVVTNGTITEVDLTNAGQGYLATDTLTVSFGTSPGSGATGTVTMSGGVLAGIGVTNGGSFGVVGSDVIPIGTSYWALTISGGGGTSAAAYAIVSRSGHSNLGSVVGVVITATGYGFSSPPSVSLSTDGTHPSFSSGIGGQWVASISLTAGGSGYTAAPEVSIVPPDGTGSGASAIATESGGAVTSLSLVASALAGLNIANGGTATSSPGTYALSFSGGGGTGAAGTATIAAINVPNGSGGLTSINSVVSFDLTNAGSGYTTSPTVSVSASFSVPAVINATTISQGNSYDTTANVLIGSGSGAAADAHVWPFLPTGTTLAIFQGRVWLGGGANGGYGQLLQWTGTGSSYGNVGYDDFLDADASGSLLLTDADLVHAITALRSLNNYLFIMGDQSVKQIGNISLNSSGNVTEFTILTLSSDQGTVWPKSCVSFNRVFLFANVNGIYGVFGSSVQKLSADLDGIFANLDPSSTVPVQGDLLDLNSIHNAIFLVQYKAPGASTVPLLLIFDGKKWWLASQLNPMSALVGASTLASGARSLYGAMNAAIQQLFGDASTAVPFTIQTGLTHHGNAVQGKKAIRAGFAAQIGAASQSLTMSVDTEAGVGTSHPMDLVDGFAVIGGANDADSDPIGAAGIYLGLTLTGTLAGLTISTGIIEYQETQLWKGA